MLQPQRAGHAPASPLRMAMFPEEERVRSIRDMGDMLRQTHGYHKKEVADAVEGDVTC
jgi:hypothetical protein